jgi:hypothetical protein
MVFCSVQLSGVQYKWLEVSPPWVELDELNRVKLSRVRFSSAGIELSPAAVKFSQDDLQLSSAQIVRQLAQHRLSRD